MHLELCSIIGACLLEEFRPSWQGKVKAYTFDFLFFCTSNSPVREVRLDYVKGRSCRSFNPAVET